MVIILLTLGEALSGLRVSHGGKDPEDLTRVMPAEGRVF
jgi:hypothetical protein